MQEGKEYPLPSGATVYVSIACWEDVKNLQDATARAINGGGINAAEVGAFFKMISGDQDGEAISAAEKLSSVAALLRKGLELASSKELERCIFKCAESALYRPDGREESSLQFKFNAAGYGVFDNVSARDKARGDYYSICAAIVEENLRPFGKALFSMFMAHVAKRADTPASNTEKA